MNSHPILFCFASVLMLANSAPAADADSGKNSVKGAKETAAGWEKCQSNPVMGGKYGTCFDISVLKQDAGYRMWLSWRSKQSIALVSSDDGIHWSEPPKVAFGPRKESGWEDEVNRPIVLKRDDGYHMWYTGQAAGHSAIGYATSADGLAWKRASDKPVLTADAPWEKVAVMCPHVIWDADGKQYRMWYSGGDQYEPNSIGYATSPDGLRWTKHAQNPIFTGENGAPWERARVTGCQVEKRGDWYLMFYIGFRDIDHAQIGIARSKDGVTGWQRHPQNPIIRASADGWDHDACYKPYAIFDGRQWLVWYNGRKGSLEQIGLAFHEGEDLGFSDDRVFADFEGDDYGPWKVDGAAFGTAPAHGKIADQWDVTGYRGHGLANSFHGGDGAVGKLTSPEFSIQYGFISFLIGGGGWESKTCINLVVDGKVVRTATGPNKEPGGSEKLEPSGWDVSELIGKTAFIEIVDTATGGWGHITVDEITFTNTKPPLATKLLSFASREIGATHQWLNFPVKQGATKRTVLVSRKGDGKIERRFEVELADGEPDWWGSLNIGAWRGETLCVTVDKLRSDSRALEQITASDTLRGHENLYREALRPQFHFSAQRGWLNDPNGLAFYNGEYHMFFQHSPFSWTHAPNFWGHAVSRDLVHWRELDDALAPDEFGGIWSGSAVVDWKNTSGFGQDGKPPLVLIYTAGGETQRIAFSTDGRTFTKVAGDPVVKTITGGNRDPKVIWHEPTQKWVMVLYVEKDRRHTIHFLTSPDLREWTLASVVQGDAVNGNFPFECPDLFELPLDGDRKNKKWILAAANTEYIVGGFDGQKFTAETEKLPGQRGGKPKSREWSDWAYYAPQTFSDEPKGRRVQIGWWQTETTRMPFNQSMSLPLELRLVSTPDGPRLTWNPIEELAALRASSHVLKEFTLAPGAADPLAGIMGELLELEIECEPSQDAELKFGVRGVPVIYDAKKQEIVVGDRHAPAPLKDGRQRIKIFVDRTGLEVLASDGRTFIPLPTNLDPQKRSLSLAASRGNATFQRLNVYELQSIWGAK